VCVWERESVPAHPPPSLSLSQGSSERPSPPSLPPLKHEPFSEPLHISAEQLF
jgi:hypothetical protein